MILGPGARFATCTGGCRKTTYSLVVDEDVTMNLRLAAAYRLVLLAAPAVETTDLGTLGGPVRIGRSVNSAGTVVGDAFLPTLTAAAFRWTKPTGMQPLGGLASQTYSIANDLNEAGVAVGSAIAPDPAGRVRARAVRWDVAGQPTVLPDLNNHPTLETIATAINNVGEVVGKSGTSVVIWHGGGMTNIGPLCGPSSCESTPNDINDARTIVGGASIGPFNETRAFRWTLAEGLLNLGTLPGGTFSVATGVNAQGQIVGYGNVFVNGSPVERAFLWDPTTRQMTNLGVPPGGSNSAAIDINDQGDIVGRAAFAGSDNDHAFLLSGGTWTKLGPNVPSLSAANSVSNRTGTKLFVSGSTDINGVRFARLWTIDLAPGENRPPTVSLAPSYAGVEGSAIGFTATASDPDVGTTLSYAWDFTGDGVIDLTSTTPTVTHTYPDNGSFQVRVAVSDGALSVAATAPVTVTNVAPSIGPVTVPMVVVRSGAPVTVSAAFTDPGVLDTHTGAIQWSAGGAFEPATVVSSMGSGTVSGTRSLAAGIHAIAVRVIDDDGGVSTRAATASVIVFDPGAGSVTGAGWFASSASSAKGVGGEAKLQFSAQYKRDDLVPDGRASFTVRDAGISFDATAIQWLVIDGARASLAASGTLNGSAGHVLRLTVVDGKRVVPRGDDVVRVVILNAAGAAVYDSDPGTPADVAVRALRGGSITVHP